MRIGFFGGVKEIGGNIILIEDKSEGIVLDFGRRFKSNNTFFNSTISGRAPEGMGDYINMGEFPPFKKFYSAIGENYRTLDVDINGVFFSHAHLDHIGNINLINDSIPKYMSTDSYSVLKFFVQYGDIERMPLNVKIIDDPVKFGSFEIRPFFVDHDVTGAVSYIIETPKGIVVYTGDIYFKGAQKERSYEFVKYIKSLKPYILITEGTRIGWGGISSLTEDEIQQEVKECERIFRGLIIGNLYEPHLTRIMSFYKIARDLKRKFVVSENYAFALSAIADGGNLIAQEIIGSDNTFIYSSKNSLETWEESYKGKFITPEDVRRDQDNIILLLSFRNIPEMIDIKPGKNAIYIQSGGEPITSIDAENAKILENWVSHFKMPYFKIHSPGHASEVEILKMAKEINPQILLPIHTQIPERFETVSSNVSILERGVMTDF
jgi:ribonuclease J